MARLAVWFLALALSGCKPEPWVLDFHVQITPHGKKFHRAKCRYLNGSGHRIERDDAIDRGYKACLVCNP